MTMPPASRLVLKRGSPPCHLRTLASVAILAAAGVLICSQALAQTALRTPVLPPLRLPPTTVWTDIRPQAGRFGDIVITDPTRKPVQTISQLDAAGILRVGVADIGADATVNVVQPSSTATLLVKPDGGLFNDMTVIEGILKANGQIYIYNPNGIIFGATSKVNVNSLVASSLKIDNQRFLAGLTAPNITPFFTTDLNATYRTSVTYRDSDGNDVPTGTPGAIAIENGASVTTAIGGRVLMVAPTITPQMEKAIGIRSENAGPINDCTSNIGCLRAIK